jgi:hypothetical protein
MIFSGDLAVKLGVHFHLWYDLRTKVISSLLPKLVQTISALPLYRLLYSVVSDGSEIVAEELLPFSSVEPTMQHNMPHQIVFL